MSNNQTVDYSSMTFRQIFQKVNDHQIEALMFHSQMTEFFNFIGMKGFKRMHEHHLCEETASRMHTKDYFMKHYRMILADDEVEDPKVLPSDWKQYTQSEVTNTVRRQALIKGVDTYIEWEANTAELYQACACALLAKGRAEDFSFVSCLADDATKELVFMNKLAMKLKIADYDMPYVLDMQHWLHKKYNY